MSVPDFLSRLKDAGIKLWAEGDRLQFDAPVGAMTDELRVEIRKLKPELLNFFREAQLMPDSTSSHIRHVRRDEVMPLSFAQQRLWFMHQLAPNSAFYNVPSATRLEGKLKLDALKWSLDQLVVRHEAVRTTFSADNGVPHQTIRNIAQIELPVVDLTDTDPDKRNSEARILVDREVQAPFDLERDTLLRARLFRLGNEDHILVLTMHHIVSDGWSMGVLMRDLIELYGARVRNADPSLPELSIQYVDFAAWQRDWLQGEVYDRQLNYWKSRLANLSSLRLPTDRARPSIRRYQGKREWFNIPKELSESIKQLSHREGVTPFMVMLAVFDLLLHRYTGSNDIAVGSPIANRHRGEIEGLIGFFVNSLVMRTDLSGDPTFRELLDRVRDTAMGAYANQDIPFGKIVEEINPVRDTGQNPLFQVIFAVQNAPMPNMIAGDLQLKLGWAETAASRFDLEFHVFEDSRGTRLGVVYDTDLFERSTIQRMFGTYQSLLEAATADPNLPISKLNRVDQERDDQSAPRLNGQSPESTIQKLFEQQASATPDAIALTFEGAQLTYDELNRRSNQLAHHLQNLGVGPETLVGVYVRRSMEMVTGLLGILKAGGAYVPLDPAYPEKRLRFMLEDAGLSVVLTDSTMLDRLPDHEGVNVCLDSDLQAISQQADTNPVTGSTDVNAAYVIYTSGTTGKPKGVVVEHRQVTRLFHSTDSWFRFGKHDVWTLFHSCAFDFSVWELWGALFYGGRLVVVPREVARSSSDFLKLLRREKVTVLNQTPSAFRALINAMDLSDQANADLSLRYVIFGGEALQLESLRPWFNRFGDQHPQLVNMYGITETTVHVTYRPLSVRDLERAGRSPIGVPIPDLTLHLLDENLKPVADGEAGEICVGGAGVARGYLRRPELTQERFVADPNSDNPDSRLYRSGDLARRLPDGELDYLGRLDHQVKIRGFRIELGEIEASMTSHSHVREAVCVMRSDQNDPRLIAYLVPDHDAVDSVDEDGSSQETHLNDDHVSNWQLLYDQSYQQNSAESDEPDFNIIGWNSSYTSEPIPADEMREWVDSTVDQIRSLGPKRVLEIGCGTGLLLARIAPHSEKYVGIDFSQVALNHVRSLIDANDELAHVTLMKRTADDLAALEPRSFDTVIINSVTQYFPNVEYLTTVLEGATNLVAPGGRLFVGDVRSLPLLRTYHTSVQFHRADESLDRYELSERINQHIDQEEELVIDPTYFHAIGQHVPRIRSAQVMVKRGAHQNELTRFRYDAVLNIEGQSNNTTPKLCLDWQTDGIGLDDLQQRMSSGEHKSFAVCRIPNARHSNDMCVERWLCDEDDIDTFDDVGSFRAHLRSRPPKDVEVESLWQTAHQYGYSIDLTYSDQEHKGCVDAVFRSLEHVSHDEVRTTPAIGSRPLREYANNPLKARLAQNIIPRVREHARRHLPDYMVPLSFMLLDSIPLTPNGKVDRTALPAISNERQLDETYVAPRGDLERRIARIWGELLEVDRIGVHDNFFDLGGHSLLLTQVFSRLVKEIECADLTMIELFQFPTIELLARHLGGEETESQVIRDTHRTADTSSNADVSNNAIAVIGMAIQFPGANDTDIFWSNLREGVESIRHFSDDELREAGIDESTLNHPNYVRAKGAIDGPEMFDAVFFGYTPNEARLIDPQQRKFLETAWESLERAGYDAQRYDGKIGVYAGTSQNTYMANIRTQPNLVESVGGFQLLVSSDKDFLPTRVSYKMNLRGPSVNVQTACSSSLVAVHEACRSLLDHQCDTAMAGGATVKVPTKGGYMYVEDGPVSPDGHCRSFDAKSQGTVWSEGVGVVVLKRLNEAIVDGDTIHAVIRGTAINNDGSMKIGFTAPSVQGQAEVIALAHAAAGIESHQINYVEAHGTATVLGDPIEIAALTKAFESDQQKPQSCAMGALKANVGHMDATAGVGGLIKTVLALKHRQIPPTVHYESANPSIDFASSPFFVNDRLRPWETQDGQKRIAGVSAFGIGGTNAHAIVEEPPAPVESGESRSWQLLTLSAKTASALNVATSNLAEHLKQNRQIKLADVAYTLQVGRCEFEHRRAVICQDIEDAIESLADPNAPHSRTGIAPENKPSVVYMFPGQGSQYIDMGKDLYASEPVFRDAVDECAALLESCLNQDIRAAIYPDDWNRDDAAEELKHTSLTQPALFTIEYATARLWMSWGLEPAAFIGHSIGEYVAACLSGVMSLADALKLVAVRGQLMEQAPTGAMVALPLTESQAIEVLDDGLCVSTINSPSMCVVSGSHEGIEAFEKQLTEQNIPARRLHTSHAFHSPLMDSVIEPFVARVRNVSLNKPSIPFISNVTGTWITESEARDPNYWGRHIRQPVRFSDGITKLLAHEDFVLLETGPGHTLKTFVQQQARGPAINRVVSCLRHPREEENDNQTITRAMGQLWLAGLTPDWGGYYVNQQRRRIGLPTYPFERERHWIDAAGPASVFGGASTVSLRKNARIGNWFYIPTWNRTAAPRLSDDQSNELAGANIVVYAADARRGTEFAAALKHLGTNCTTVSDSGQFGSLDQSARPKFVFFISNNDDVDSTYYELMDLVRNIGAENENAPSLIVVTQSSKEVTGQEVVNPHQAKIAGLSIVIRQEYPQLNCRNIDVDIIDERVPERLLVEAVSADKEPLVAYRGTYRWTPSHARTQLEPAANKPHRLRDGGTYLITGGMGRIGLELAEFLAESANANLVLLSRSQFPARDEWDQWISDHDENDSVSTRIRRIRAIEAKGANVVVCAGDVADEAQMEGIICDTEERFGTVHGVFHLAAAMSGPSMNRPIAELKRRDCEDHHRPKVEGLIVLDKVLRDRALDFVIVTSSLASVLGGIGFGAYAPANAFVDAFVTQRRSDRRTPWISVNWDGWRFGNEQTPDMSPVAKLSMTPAEGIDAFARVLHMTQHEPQVIVSTADLQARIDRWVVADDPREKHEEAPAATRPELANDYVAPSTDIEIAIADVWQELLGIDRIGAHDNFFELGGHSLLATIVNARLRDQFAVELNLQTLFNAPTVSKLADYILESLVQHDDEVSEQLLSELQDMTPDQIAAALADEDEGIEADGNDR